MNVRNGRLVVLALDDNPSFLKHIASWLAEVPGWESQLVAYTSTDEALAALPSSGASVVLVDHYLDGARTGIDVFHEIRRAGHDMPVILMSGRGDEAMATSGMQAGVSDYLPKSLMSARVLERSITNALEKHKLQRALAEYRRSLERSVHDLRVRGEEIQSFYQTLAHELKTPLTSAREFISILLDGLAGPLNGDQREYLEIARRNCDQLVTCIDDILDASRLETGRVRLRLRPCTLAVVVRRVAMCAVAAAEEKGLRVELDLPPDLPPALADEQRVFQVLANLLSNAIKFTEAGTIVVRAGVRPRDSSLLEVSVSDTGRGIAPGQIDRIFDRLYQVREDDSMVLGGLGLGLSICRDLVQQHGGTIGVETRLGRGSTFTFTLPRCRDALSSRLAPEEPVAGAIADACAAEGPAP